MKQRYQKRQPQDADSVEYFLSAGISQPLAEMLSARGVCAANFQDFFGEGRFHSPFEMKNMREAAETLSFVLEEGGSVLICGDYDADGLTASSILSLFFSDNGVDNDVIVPTREQGYGLHADLVIKAFEKKFYDLVITVDCGISNKAEVAQIMDELGTEVIVTDHHELPEQLPDCICVNPKLGYPFPYLSGAGVAWKLVEALAGRETAAKYSQLAMIGTIGDLMPLRDENRSIVKMGLANFRHKSLQKLAELSKCPSQLSASDVAMKITPKINAAGRVENPVYALKVLLARDKTDVASVNKLLELNELRKTLLADIVAEADGMCDSEVICRERLTFLHSESWATGILGIAATRYKERYNLPAVVLTRDKTSNLFVGSARGVEGLDLFEIFVSCADLLDHYGGHKAAVGFSVKEENLQPLRQRLSQKLLAEDASLFEKKLYYDVDLQGQNIADVYRFTQKMQPLLPQDKVVCLVHDVVKFARSFGKDDAHLSATLAGGLEIKGFFNYGRYAPYIKNGADIQALVSLEKDDYTGNVCGVIEDLSLLNSVCFDDFYRKNFLRRFVTENVASATREQAENLLKQPSTLAVFDDYETFLQESKRFDFEDFALDIFFPNSMSSKTVVVSPNADYNFDRYKNVLCFVKQGAMVKVDGATYFAVQPANEKLYALPMQRKVCVAVYTALKNKGAYDSLEGVFDKYLLGKISYDQYIVALRVFVQLNLLSIKDRFTITLNTAVKAELENSPLYRYFATP